MTVYCIDSIMWSAVGFAAGYAVRSYTMRRFQRPTWQQALGTLLVFLSLMSMLIVARYSTQLNNQSKRIDAVIACEAGYFQSYTNALQARDESTQRGRDSSKEQALAARNLWLEFLKNAPANAGDRPTDAQRDASIAALNRWLASVDSYVVSVNASSQVKFQYPIPDNRCPKPSNLED